jgi:hypothetical protein
MIVTVASGSKCCVTVGTAGFSSEQVAQLQALTKACKDAEFAQFVNRITKPV